VDPLRLGGIRGKKSTPSVWLGGTSVVSTVDKQVRHGAQESFAVRNKATVCSCIL
jgi:hypothetical protein